MPYDRTPRADPDPLVDPGSLDYHDESARGWVTRFGRMTAQVAAGRLSAAAVAPQLLPCIANAVVLRRAWRRCGRRGGAAPGPDGLRFADVTGRELWKLCRGVGADIRAGTYRPGPERVVQVPKGGGRGTRPVCVQSAVDRAVQRAAADILTPLVDPTFAGLSFGYRPGRDRRHALAAAEAFTYAGGRTAWATADVRDAFGSVPVGRVVDLVRSRFPAPDLAAFLTAALGPPRGGQRPGGLRQGGSLSPLLTNWYFDHYIDRPWRRDHPDIPLVRYVDDLLALARTPAEAAACLADLGRLLRPAGLTLKPPGRAAAVRDLAAGRTAAWLGFVVRQNKSALSVRPTRSAYARLERTVARAYAGADGSAAADAAVRGWVRQMGPAYRTVRVPAALGKVAAACAAAGFDEYPAAADLAAEWAAGHDDWQVVRGRVRRELAAAAQH